MINPKSGKLYVLTEDGNLVRLNNSKQKVSPSSHTPIQNVDTTLVVNLGPGRPLGGKFTYDGKTLYIADTLLGLVRVQNVENKKSQSKVEIVASSVVDKEGNESRILYANDVDIGPVTGHVYFTDCKLSKIIIDCLRMIRMQYLPLNVLTIYIYVFFFLF